MSTQGITTIDFDDCRIVVSFKWTPGAPATRLDPEDPPEVEITSAILHVRDPDSWLGWRSTGIDLEAIGFLERFNLHEELVDDIHTAMGGQEHGD